MKKFFLVGLITLFTFCFIQAASITISQPAADQRVCKGSTLPITWTSVDVPGPLKIILFRVRDRSRVETIQSSTANDGNHPWPVPLSLPDDSYFIRVATLASAESRVVGNSPNFIITTCRRSVPAGPSTVQAPDRGPRPNIRVLAPDGSRKISMNSDVRISWTADNIPAGKKLAIDLFQNKDLKGTIEWDLDRGRLSHVWRVGELKAGRWITPGSDFKIKVYIMPAPGTYHSWSRSLRIEEERTVDLRVEVDLYAIIDSGRKAQARLKVRSNRFSGTYRNVRLYYYLLLDNPEQTLIDTKVYTCLPMNCDERLVSWVIFKELRFGEYANLDGRNRPRNFILKAVIDPTDSVRDINRRNNTHLFRFRN